MFTSIVNCEKSLKIKLGDKFIRFELMRFITPMGKRTNLKFFRVQFFSDIFTRRNLDYREIEKLRNFLNNVLEELDSDIDTETTI